MSKKTLKSAIWFKSKCFFGRKKNSIELCLLPKSGIKQRFFSSVDFSLYMHQFEHFIWFCTIFPYFSPMCTTKPNVKPSSPSWLGMYKKNSFVQIIWSRISNGHNMYINGENYILKTQIQQSYYNNFLYPSKIMSK